MSDKEDHYSGAILEEIRDMFITLREGQADMASMPGRLSNLENDMTEMKSDIRVMKIALTDLSKSYDGLENRVTVIEKKAA